MLQDSSSCVLEWLVRKKQKCCTPNTCHLKENLGIVRIDSNYLRTCIFFRQTRTIHMIHMTITVDTSTVIVVVYFQSTRLSDVLKYLKMLMSKYLPTIQIQKIFQIIVQSDDDIHKIIGCLFNIDDYPIKKALG